ncbi:MAG: hypothetical protein M1839_006829 [Geoglossum umbratile]|nr:MAG: hypothetical protein M1839_006829 [Geoglossum umbratile]
MHTNCTSYGTGIWPHPPYSTGLFVHQLDVGVISEGTHDGLYARHTLRDYFPKLDQPSSKPRPGPFAMPNPWHGAPTAALLRAFQVSSSPLLRGIPIDVPTDLNMLIQLYRRDLPDTDMVKRENLSGEAERQDRESTGSGATSSSYFSEHERAVVADLYLCAGKPGRVYRPAGVMWGKG